MGSDIGRIGVFGRRAGRRGVLGAGAAGVVGLAGLAWPGAARAQEAIDDLGLLAFLLSLEQVEAALFDEGLERFTDAEWEDALGLASARLDLETIRDQEGAHAAALATAIGDLGGTPPDPVRYDFGYEDAPGFVRLAAGIAETVTAGYAGVVPLLQDPAAQQTAVGILVVEGRHAAYLKLRAGESPFPEPIDQPLSREEVLANLAGYAEGEPAPAPTLVPDAEPTTAPVADAEPTAAPVVDADRNVFAAVIADAAAVLGVEPEDVELAEVTEVEWPDASLGCPEPGNAYAEVLTPGFRVIVRAAGETLEYHTDQAERFVRCV
jgi:hypothetical protein